MIESYLKYLRADIVPLLSKDEAGQNIYMFIGCALALIAAIVVTYYGVSLLVWILGALASIWKYLAVGLICFLIGLAAK